MKDTSTQNVQNIIKFDFSNSLSYCVGQVSIAKGIKSEFMYTRFCSNDLTCPSLCCNMVAYFCHQLSDNYVDL